uniref:HK97 gp10 family phage protein n=1 Tax=Myoviridae sp. ct2Pw37 TaxID=2825021 RepID=A0A8S5PC62_9CAUD|nr:MAG TPA: hypothetical protein [Myoviridae sp. ct2Pw37]
MANFEEELPRELIKQFEGLEDNATEMMKEMTKVGADIVYKNVKSNMKKSFKTTKALEKGLRITKVYRTSNDEIASKIAFYGYDKEKKSKQYPSGVPIPLIALAREYGTSSGEKKKPFFRKSFKKKEIEDAMLKIQEKYLPKE